MNQCRYGDECSFAHGEEKLEVMPDLRKTSICKDWRHGTCPYDSIYCPFAHGKSELRQTEDYMHNANVYNVESKFKVSGLEEYSMADSMRVDSKLWVNEPFPNRRMLDTFKLNSQSEVDRLEELSTASTRSGSVPMDA